MRCIHANFIVLSRCWQCAGVRPKTKQAQPQEEADTDSKPARKQPKISEQYCTELVDVKKSGDFCLHKVQWERKGRAAPNLSWAPARSIHPELIAQYHEAEVRCCAPTMLDIRGTIAPNGPWVVRRP